MSKLFHLFVILFLLIAIGCSSKKEKTSEEARLQKVSYQDSVFLGFEGDLNYDPTIIWSHMDIYVPAFNRFMRHIYIKDHRLVTDFKNGKAIGISENIYSYLINVTNGGNKNLSQSTEYAIFQDTLSGYYYVTRNSKFLPGSLKKVE